MRRDASMVMRNRAPSILSVGPGMVYTPHRSILGLGG
jgi:hypothetical protein